MLNEKDEKLLENLLKLCSGDYKLLSGEDFEDKNYKISLEKLSENEYIILKYSSGDDYLIKVTKKGKDYFECKNGEVISRAVLTRKSAVNALIGGLIGGFAGSFIAFLISFFIWWHYA